MIGKIKNLVPGWRWTRREILARDFRSLAPVAVFQMGGVGSSTVYDTLLAAGLPNPVYHVHYLSQKGIREAEAFHRRLPDPSIPDELRLSESLRRKMKRDPKDRWLIITLMRDPVARRVSSFFHNAWTHCPEVFNAQGQMDPEKALKALEDDFHGKGRENPRYSWFEHEFKQALSMDARSLPMEPGQGYAMAEKGRFKVLALRLEDLESVFHMAVSRLIGLEKTLDAPMVRTNLALERDYYPAYQHARERLKLPGSVLTAIYGDAYVRHFYTQGEIALFRERWS